MSIPMLDCRIKCRCGDQYFKIIFVSCRFSPFSHLNDGKKCSKLFPPNYRIHTIVLYVAWKYFSRIQVNTRHLTSNYENQVYFVITNNGVIKYRQIGYAYSGQNIAVNTISGMQFAYFFHFRNIVYFRSRAKIILSRLAGRKAP